MSLITEALRAAQREKMERQGITAPAAAVLGFFPVRTAQERGRSVAMWALGTAATLLVVTSAVLVARARMYAPRPAVAVQQSASQPPTAASPTPAPPLPNPAAARTAKLAVPTRSARVPSADSSRAVQLLRTRFRDSLLTAMRSLGPPPAPLPLLEGYPVVPQAEAQAMTPRTRPSRGTLSISLQPPGGRDALQLFELAVIAHNNGDLATARRLYEQSIALDGSISNVHNNLGALLTAIGDVSRALNELHRAVSLDPSNAAAWTNLGGALRAQGRADEAVAAFQHALTLDPKNVVAQVGLAQQYLAIGGTAEARRLLERVVAENPSAVEAHYSLAQLLEQSGDRAGALREYRAFLSLAEPRFAAYAERVRRHVELLVAESR